LQGNRAEDREALTGKTAHFLVNGKDRAKVRVRGFMPIFTEDLVSDISFARTFSLMAGLSTGKAGLSDFGKCIEIDSTVF
jgi:hypothetical protein